jgi:hypothetical protein
MINIFTWLLVKDDRSVRVVLADNVAVSVGPDERARLVRAWTYGTAEDARETAITVTEEWEEAGYSLYDGVHVARMALETNDLTKDCLMQDRVGPVLGYVLATLTLDGEPL